ncbi:hypothetical protein IJ556_04190, partial [bacterium]|nr:hypothetical protein [bacterium]
KPISRAPELRTVNGCGFMLYRSSDPIDFNIIEHTYVSTLYFVFFFIPIFPVARYRVSSKFDGSYRFYGKLPLTKGNMIHILVFVSLIVFAFFKFSDMDKNTKKQRGKQRYSYVYRQKYDYYKTEYQNTTFGRIEFNHPI